MINQEAAVPQLGRYSTVTVAKPVLLVNVNKVPVTVPVRLDVRR